jgi:SAM-dependent methyltransferase
MLRQMASTAGGILLDIAEKTEADCRVDMLPLFERNPAAKLLDIGCADGTITMRVARRIGTRDVVGLDIVPANMRAARARGIEPVGADLDSYFPFRDGAFDVICASHCIEHVKHTDLMITESYRVLKPGGYLVIATPNLAAWHHIAFLLLGKQPTIAEVSDEALVGTLSPRGNRVGRLGPAHRRIFTPGALKGLCEYHGFTVDRVLGSGFFPFRGRAAKALMTLDNRHFTNMIVRARKPPPPAAR